MKTLTEQNFDTAIDTLPQRFTSLETAIVSLCTALNIITPKATIAYNFIKKGSSNFPASLVATLDITFDDVPDIPLRCIVAFDFVDTAVVAHSRDMLQTNIPMSTNRDVVNFAVHLDQLFINPRRQHKYSITVDGLDINEQKAIKTFVARLQHSRQIAVVDSH